MQRDNVLSGTGTLHLRHSSSNNQIGRSFGQTAADRLSTFLGSLPRQALIGTLLVIALLAFEMFNFDTTQYALDSLLGQVSFMNLRWATILAVAFCAIDFAGLAYLFGTGRDQNPHHEVWYLMGAWLLGATMNALMTWWAVSVTLLNHEFGNEVLSREELLNIVPIFVAVLVWLTRILFIGAFSVAGIRLFHNVTDRQLAQVNDGLADSSKVLRQNSVKPAMTVSSSNNPRTNREVQRARPLSEGDMMPISAAAADQSISTVQQDPDRTSGRLVRRPPRPKSRPAPLAPTLSARTKRR